MMTDNGSCQKGGVGGGTPLSLSLPLTLVTQKKNIKIGVSVGPL